MSQQFTGEKFIGSAIIDASLLLRRRRLHPHKLEREREHESQTLFFTPELGTKHAAGRSSLQSSKKAALRQGFSGIDIARRGNGGVAGKEAVWQLPPVLHVIPWNRVIVAVYSQSAFQERVEPFHART